MDHVLFLVKVKENHHVMIHWSFLRDAMSGPCSYQEERKEKLYDDSTGVGVRTFTPWARPRASTPWILSAVFFLGLKLVLGLKLSCFELNCFLNSNLKKSVLGVEAL
jgi:hypothetical protein